jgi:methylamine dehydrogenase accessory protein MauD
MHVNAFWVISQLVLGCAVLGLALLLLGALRGLKRWAWRLEQLEADLSSRRGLPPGTTAPRFSLPSMQGASVALKNFADRRVLLVFTRSDGHPWPQLLPELNRLQQRGAIQVLLIETGGLGGARQAAAGASFPVLLAGTNRLARRYRVGAMPCAFLIDEQGVIRSNGIVSDREHLDFVLTADRPERTTAIAAVRSPFEKFVPRPDDVFIVTYPRSGTTWMQMILYQLTTDGNMDFSHITQVCPWFERSLGDGTAYDALPGPRVFKSHLSHDKIPKGPCKYLYVVRNGKDVAVSYYHFYVTHEGFEGTFEEFFERFLAGQVHYGSWFTHFRRWWEHRGDGNVLLLRYEDLIADLPGCLKRISAFCGLEVAAERWPGILERCSFAFMKQHESQFDSSLGTLYERGWRPQAFLRKGKAGAWGDQLSRRQARRFDKAYHRRLGHTALDHAPAPPSSGESMPCCASTTVSGQRDGPSH